MDELSNETIVEFQELYRAEYGVAISRELACEYGSKLIDLVKIVYGHRMPSIIDAVKKRGYDGNGGNFIKG